MGLSDFKIGNFFARFGANFALVKNTKGFWGQIWA